MARSLFDPELRGAVLDRLRSLRPGTPARWGRMDAPRMVAHLTDQMGHTLGDVPVTPHRGLLRLRVAKWAAIYLLPWPRGRIQGPPEAFVRRPGEWQEDLARLGALVRRFGDQDPGRRWPDHLLFGPMSGPDWGVFCYKHFDHHLRQFGA